MIIKHRIAIQCIYLICIFIFRCDQLQAQIKYIPIDVSVRTSFFGGSYVLQLKNRSSQQLQIWLAAKEKVATYHIPTGETKDIGWVQGFRFDANDLFFVWGEGYDTIKQAMPSNELSPWKVTVPKEGGLAVSFSQSFLQDQLLKQIKLPIKKYYPKALELEISEIPQIILKEESDRFYTTVIIHTKLFSGKLNVPINTTVSFVPFYTPANGVISASQIRIDNIDVNILPKNWLGEVTEIINTLLPALFATYDLFQINKSDLKYINLINVRQIVIRDGRLEILI